MQYFKTLYTQAIQFLEVGEGGGVGCIFFLEDICDIVHGIFDTKIKQHMISTGSIDSITKIN